MAAIFNFSLIRTSGSVRGSLVVLPDLKNMSMAVGLSMLSCTQADIDVISYQLPVNSHYLGFPAYPYIGHLRNSSALLPVPKTLSMTGGISFLLCIQAETYVISYLLPLIGRHI
jgi:hypothetical protein